MIDIKAHSFVVLALALATTACPGKVTGGGQMIQYGEKIANFGFNGNSCGEDVKGHFNYVSKDKVVKMNGEVTDVLLCEDDVGDCSKCANLVGLPSYRVDFEYRSTNPKISGEGEGLACATDNGEGANAFDADQIAVKVFSGPFGGYVESGSVQGNINEHACD